MKIQINKDGCYLNDILQREHSGDLILTFDNVACVKFLDTVALIIFEDNKMYSVEIKDINKILK